MGKVIDFNQFHSEEPNIDSMDKEALLTYLEQLREKIEKNPSEPKFVHTKWGAGYYFKV